MPWFVPWSESIKKRACRYLLQRYLGQFFEQKLTLEQLSVNLYHGTGTVADISLDVQALNELGEQQNWPMEFVDGYIEQMSIFVPWSALLKESSNIEVRGLNITVQPKQRSESATSMFESMWSSMTSSMQLAQECLQQEMPNAADNAQPLEGIERFAQTIDSILSRVKVKFVNTIIRLEHVSKDCNTGVAMQIHIANLEYLDEAGDDPPTSETTELTNQDENKAYVISSFTLKKLVFEGVTFSSEEFPSRARTFSRSVMSQSQASVNLEQSKASEDVFLSTIIEDSIRRGSDAGRESSVESTPVIETPNTQFLSDVPEHEPILFGKLSGRQEIRIRLKQSEAISGPKVSMEMTFGSLMLFLSPRQLHVLLELAEGVASPHLEDTSNVPNKSRCQEKPMRGLDFQRIEQELQQQLNPVPPLAAGLQNTKGWSTASFDEEDDNDLDFLPMRNQFMSDSVLSSTNSMDSSISTSISSASSRSPLQRVHRRGTTDNLNVDLDPTAEITHFQIRLASLAIVLLHEDLLTLANGIEQTLVPSTVAQMKYMAETFFNNLGPFGTTGYGNKDFENARAIFEKACQLNHIRLLAAPIQIEGDQKSTLTAHALSLGVTAAKLELLECLWSSGQEPVEYVKLLSEIEEPDGRVLSYSPFFRLEYKHVEKIVKHSHQKTCPNKSEINLHLNKCITEVDITIIDRISAVLNPQPVCNTNKMTPLNENNPLNPVTENIVSDYKYDLKLTCPLFIIKLRFPIPDFRQPHDMQRIPWWKRNVRPDFLTLQMVDASVISCITSAQICFKYEIQCRSADLYYTDESAIAAPLHIGKICVDCKSSLPDGFNWPRMTIEVYPIVLNSANLDDRPDNEKDPMSMGHSMDGFGELKNDPLKGPSPFSSKKVVHESDTPHKTDQQNDAAPTEVLIIPGDRIEMANFIESSIRTSRLRLELFVPTVSLQLVSKHIYELLYNRINTDLLLWEPSAPRPQSSLGINATHLGCDLQESIYPMFSMCKSGIQYESESESDEASIDGESEGVFYSFCESKKSSNKTNDIIFCGQSFLSFNIHILQGILCMNPPVRDTALNVIPEQQGELLLIVEDASIFTVSQYLGDPNLAYVCVQAVSASLHHSDLTSTPSQSAPLKEFDCTLPRHLYTTIHKSEPGVALQAINTDRCSQRDMLSVAVKVKANHETHHMKTITVAVGVKLATLRHRMCAEPNSWFTQMIDFFDVLDYPIPGYNPMPVVTEFHLHLWDCAIDYRPYYLPLRSLLALGNFSMSSNLSAQANSSTLRFIAEECYLFLSDKGPPKGRILSIAPVDLRRDYVCVVELSLFELSLKLTDKQKKGPHIDLRASNNIVHIRTCADTARALMQLITYFATDGDLAQKDLSSISSEQSTPRKPAPSEQLLSVEPQEISGLSTSQHQQVNELLGEAMKESLMAPLVQQVIEAEGVGTDVFFFPDESRPIPEIIPVSVQHVLERRNSHKSSDTDEEFCFVGDEAGLGILPKSGLPEIRWLTHEPVRIIDNHFTIPVGKTDLLKPPKHFPDAILRYTLCEMTLVWHIYGGHDFQTTANEKDTQKKTVNFTDDRPKISDSEISFSKSNTCVTFKNVREKQENLTHNWRTKGGVKRDHDVLMELQLNKVRFQHEIYPENTIQASRQVLLVSEVEVRDRLASSHFNKFLYQHTSQSRPKQSHANMIVIKVTHIRPDPKLTAQECILRVSILPLRLNVDQDSLLFLVGFFNELGGQDQDKANIDEGSRHTTPTHQPPVMTVTVDNQEEVKQQAQKLVSDNLLILLEEDETGSTDGDSLSDGKKMRNIQQSGEETPPPIYFRNVLFSPEVLIRLDYQGKHVDMSHGPLAGLLMGLGQLNCSEIRLKRLSHRHGLLGMDKLVSFALHEWLQDIKRHQLPSLLGGFGPMHSFVQLFQGIRDLFWLPIEQYQKDGRLVRGLQRGANSFTTSTAMAALELTSRIIHLIQATAETAYDMVSPGPSVRRRPVKGRKGKRKHYSQPQDIREGMANAYMVVKEGIGETAGNIVRVASQEHEQKGYSGAVGGVLRQIPPTFVKPIIIASEATNNVLGGMRSQLVPDARREASQKWRTEEG